MTHASVTKLSRPSVEYSLTDHCNIRCQACAHASPVLPEKFADVESFSRDFEALAQAFHSEELRLVGGEPLLHPELLRFASEARRIGIADSIVLYTNGVLLHQAPGDLWRSIDELRISAYPGVTRRLSDEECARLCQEHGVTLRIENYDTFSQALLGKAIEDRRLVKAIYRACEAATGCHTVRDGRFYKCPLAPIMRSWLTLRHVDFTSPESDGVALHDNPTLRQDLERYVASPTPLAACDYCLGSSGASIPHRQLNRAGCTAWLNEDSQPLIDAVKEQLLGRRGWRSAVQKVKALLKT